MKMPRESCWSITVDKPGKNPWQLSGAATEFMVKECTNDKGLIAKRAFETRRYCLPDPRSGAVPDRAFERPALG
jgi:hypothetical protein